MSGCNYFFASSPRHLLLYAGLALEMAQGADNRLFFIEHVPAADVTAYLAAIERWPASPFSQIEALKGDYRTLLAESGDSSRRARNRIKKRFRQENKAVLDAALADRPPDAIYLGVDDFYEAQYLLHRSQQINPARIGVYVEDGVACYEYSYQRSYVRNLPKEWIRALRYFPWWRPSTLPGASSWLTQGYVAFPDLVLDRFKRKRLDALPRERFLSPELRQLAQLICMAFGVDLARVQLSDVLIAVTHSKWGRLLPGYRETMRDICTELLAGGKHVATKPHPRDPEQNTLGIAEHPNLYRVPGQAMFEALIMLIDNPRLIVVGDASTALVATKWLRPDAEVIALRHDPDGIDGQYLQRIFDAIGVAIVTDADTLTARCLDAEGSASASAEAGAA